MNILVYGVAAESGGALSVLTDFYKQFKERKENHYYFVVSTPHFDEADNITVLRFPAIKKGWGHRLFFEYVKAPKLVKQYQIDEVFSTTNTILPRVAVKQTLYLHQALPFTEYRFKFTENRLFWTYQNIIGKMIKNSVKHAQSVIVQTQWMKDAVSQQCHVPVEKIKVMKPEIDASMIKKYQPELNKGKVTFFYPAAADPYKNHTVILKACRLLKEQKANINFQIIFTLQNQADGYEGRLFQYVEKYQLPVNFVGTLSRQEVFQWYAKSILIFPSYIETFGMPLAEARMSNSPILASDMPFSREILDGYDKVQFFAKDDYQTLAEEMKICMLL